ncbi:MAG: hypothetical protein HY706_00410 [Candidatus Hydrogenedentes bacterium]|nr:hypothetical protein [Candidatus Hydrogenedentota bacterium]
MLMLPAALFFHAAAQIEQFTAPGFGAPVAGVWYAPGEATSALPLGALGTGFVDFTSRLTFGNTTTENTWLKPQSVGTKCGIEISVAGKSFGLYPDTSAAPTSARFCGHFPMADVDFHDDFSPVEMYLRAFAPVVAHDYEHSSRPIAFFHFTVKNKGAEDSPVRIALQWEAASGGEYSEDGDVSLLKGEHGSYAVGGTGTGWALANSSPHANTARIEASVTLKPGEERDLVLALAWYFPEWTSSDGEVLRHRYASEYADGGAVLAASLPEALAIERKIIAWQERIYRSKVPNALKDAVINGLYILARNSWWLDDWRFFQSESFTGCAITETFVCRFNGSFPLAVLFPECEKATMRAVASAQAESGEIPFGLGTPMGSHSPMFHLQHPIVSSEFVLVTWRNYVLWRDENYLAEMYPHIKKALRFAMTLDTDNDGVINEDPGSEKGFPANQYYDIWPWWGTSAYTGSIWLAALKAGAAAAKKQKDAPFAEELHMWLERATRAFEEKLWTGQYYRLYNDPVRKRVSETSLTNALCGQWFAYCCGLDGILPEERIDFVIDTVLRLNVRATPYGAVNGVGPNGAADESFPDHSAVITIGEVWNFCAMAAFAGREQEATDLFVRSYENLVLAQRTPWNISWSLDRKTGALKWGINYYSNPCVWTLLQALDPKCYEGLARSR